MQHPAILFIVVTILTQLSKYIPILLSGDPTYETRDIFDIFEYRFGTVREVTGRRQLESTEISCYPSRASAHQQEQTNLPDSHRVY